MSAADNFPNWVMLESIIFRRDDEEAFPDERIAPIRATGTTSWCAPFRVAFILVDAPKISRLYAQLPGFPDPSKQTPLAILATHHHLALFRVGMQDTTGALLQDFFIYDASDADNPSSSLIRLPICTLRDKDETARLRRPPPPPSRVEYRRVMTIASMGLLSRGQGEPDFSVAELNIVCPYSFLDPAKAKVHADLFYLLSSAPRSGARKHARYSLRSSGPRPSAWNYARLAVRSSDGSNLTWSDFSWMTNTVIPANNCLCWIDYYRGMVSCNLFQKPLTLTFSGFPQDEFSLADPMIASSWYYCSASAIDAGDALKIVRVIRHDGKRYGPLNTDSSFTITCNTYQLDTTGTSTVWKRDYNRDCAVTSEELWSCNTPENLPRKILMFPHVNIDRPNIVHFLIIDEFKYVMKKMSVVTIDMGTGIAESCLPYIKGQEDIGTEYADLMKRKSGAPNSFLPSDFSKFLNKQAESPLAEIARDSSKITA